MRAYQRGIEFGRKQAELAAEAAIDAAYERGVAIGRQTAVAQRHAVDLGLLGAEPVEGQLVTSEPSDYEVWRDALLIASPVLAWGGDAKEVLEIARHVIRPSLLDCGAPPNLEEQQ